MEAIMRQVNDLKTTISRITFGSTSDQLLQLLNRFERILTESTEVKVEPSAFEQDDLGLDELEPDDFDPDFESAEQGLDGVKEEADDESFSGELRALLDEDMTNEGDDHAEVDGPMSCKLCEVADAAGNGGQDFLFNTDGSSTSHTYLDWKELCHHVKEEHCRLSSDLLKDSCYTINGGDLIHSSGKLIKSCRVLTKYSVMSCPLCALQLNPGGSYKNGFLKMCFHLYVKHKQSLPSHMPLHQCRSCSYSSYSEMLLDRHVEYNHSAVKNKYNQKVSCPVCHKSILQRFLAQHLSTIHNLNADFESSEQQRLKCDSCAKKFSSKKNLERHVQRVHQQFKEFLCQYCCSSFYENRRLLDHMYTKHNVNPEEKPVIYCQAEGCQFSSLNKDQVDKHFIAHHKESKSFICARCGKAFKSQSNLKQHEEVMHATGDNYRCPQCPFTTHAQQYLKRHMKIHSDTKKYQCTFAGCTYKSHFSENLKKHSKIHLPHHKLKAQAKRDHNYIKSKRKSTKQASSTVVCSAPQHSGTQPLFTTKQAHMQTANHYITYSSPDVTMAIQPAQYQQALPSDVKQEAYANKVHCREDAAMMNQKIEDPVQDMISLHSLPDPHQLYQCHQPFDDLSHNAPVGASSYISL